MNIRTKRIIGAASVIAVLAIAAPIFYYVNDFHQLHRSPNPPDWGTFGDFFGGILNPIISLLTMIVTIAIAVQISNIEKRNHDETVHSPVKHPDGLYSLVEVGERDTGAHFSCSLNLASIGAMILSDMEPRMSFKSS